MLFNSLEFAVFFPLVALLFFALPARARVPLLLAASCCFYMAFVPKYILILFAVILIDYCAGLWIEQAQGTRRKMLLGLSIAANVSLLGFFKYYNFARETATSLAHALGWSMPLAPLEILLPIGLSFHTFQSLSYTIEVYRGRTPAERSLLHFGLYVLFFPQLVAGPIERPQNLLPQFHATQRFDADRVFDGLRLIASGLFLKVIIADRLAPLVDVAYGASERCSGWQLLLATYFFAVQIYCDFAGYSTIARGTARVLGFELMENFRRPYLAASLSDFWRRWHISLSTWFRDYVYVPMGGNRASAGRRAVNLLVVFLLSGAWHGANWTFIVWGLLHGLFLIAEITVLGPRRERTAPSVLSRLAGQFIMVNFVALAWVFFRAPNLPQAWAILTRITTSFASAAPLPAGWDTTALVVAFGLIAILFAIESLSTEKTLWAVLDAKPRWIRWSAYYVFAVVFVTLALLGPDHSAKPFIYFQF